MLDLIVRGGVLVDGTGAPRATGDIGVLDGRIVAIGHVDESAASTIDADGAIVAPGFIDVHTHYDAQVMWDPALTPSSIHGVTTVMAGNCGFSVAPLRPDTAEYLMSMLARVEGMPLVALESAVAWDWESTADYFDRVDERAALNMGFMVGHSAIRSAVMRGEANEREATPAELDAMVALLREGLAAGGMGFSTSLARTHLDASGDPVPSRAASTEELLRLAEVCGEFSGTSLEMVPQAGGRGFDDATRSLMIAMSARSGRALNWNVVLAHSKNRDEVTDKLAVGDEARAEGGRVLGLLMPMPMVLRLNLDSGFVLDMLPGWEKPMALPHDEKVAMLHDPVGRAHLRDLSAQGEPPSPFGRWERYVLWECFSPETKRFEGRLVGDIAREEGRDPFDVLVDIALVDDLRTTFGYPQRGDGPEDWAELGRRLQDERVLIGGSDAGAHLDMINTFSYATSLLQHGVREHQLLTTEDAVHLLTQVPADAFGLHERGVLREGACADLVLFDEDTVGAGPIHTRADVPGGSSRLYADSTGVSHVIVNGTPVISGGNITGATPGGVLRSGRDTVTQPAR